MDCACVYVGDADGCFEFSSRRTVTARKSHVCDECRCEIKPGDEYEYAAGKWAGDMYQNKTCRTCLEIRDTFFCDGWAYGQIYDDFWEHICSLEGELPERCLAGLSPAARGNVCGEIEKYWSIVGKRPNMR